MSFLLNGFAAVTWQQLVMYVVGVVLIYLAIKKNYEPSLLLPMGFGAILVNLPFSGALNQNIGFMKLELSPPKQCPFYCSSVSVQ